MFTRILCLCEVLWQSIKKTFLESTPASGRARIEKGASICPSPRAATLNAAFATGASMRTRRFPAIQARRSEERRVGKGIAGPGDTLATPFALDTFRLVKKEFPQLIRCMSTNGLLLNDKADEVIDVGIDTLTVTVNAVDPEIEAMINARIFYHGKTYTGVEAAEILIHNQLEGIRKVAKSGTLIKVNTVLCPGINDQHIEDLAATVREAGAIIYNIIPLIPQNGFKDLPAPTAKTLAIAQEQAGVFINVFKHCAHCRADAVGVPGVYDIGAQIYMDRIRVKETFSHG